MRFSGIKQILQKNLPKPLNELLLMLKYQIKKIPDYDIYLSHLSNKKGIEIGGPSPLFKITLPVYKVVASLDSVNFSNRNINSKNKNDQSNNSNQNSSRNNKEDDASDRN